MKLSFQIKNRLVQLAQHIIKNHIVYMIAVLSVTIGSLAYADRIPDFYEQDEGLLSGNLLGVLTGAHEAPEIFLPDQALTYQPGERVEVEWEGQNHYTHLYLVPPDPDEKPLLLAKKLEGSSFTVQLPNDLKEGEYSIGMKNGPDLAMTESIAILRTRRKEEWAENQAQDPILDPPEKFDPPKDELVLSDEVDQENEIEGDEESESETKSELESENERIGNPVEAQVDPDLNKIDFQANLLEAQELHSDSEQEEKSVEVEPKKDKKKERPQYDSNNDLKEQEDNEDKKQKNKSEKKDHDHENDHDNRGDDEKEKKVKEKKIEKEDDSHKEGHKKDDLKRHQASDDFEDEKEGKNRSEKKEEKKDEGKKHQHKH